jgi:hypothetical protein
MLNVYTEPIAFKTDVQSKAIFRKKAHMKPSVLLKLVKHCCQLERQLFNFVDYPRRSGSARLQHINTSRLM